MKRLVKYFKEVIQELKKVSWPDKKQTFSKTVLVIIVCLIMAIYIGGLDMMFQQLMQLIK